MTSFLVKIEVVEFVAMDTTTSVELVESHLVAIKEGGEDIKHA